MESSRHYFHDSRYIPSRHDYSDYDDRYDLRDDDYDHYYSRCHSYYPRERDPSSYWDYDDCYLPQQRHSEPCFVEREKRDQERLMDCIIEYMSFMEENRKRLEKLVNIVGQLTEIVLKQEAERKIYIESDDDEYEERRLETKDTHHGSFFESRDLHKESRVEGDIVVNNDSLLQSAIEKIPYFELPSLNSYLKSLMPETYANSTLIIFHDVSGTHGVRIRRRSKPIKYPGNVCGQGAKPP